MEFLKKNAGLIIFVGILLIVVWYYFLRKKKAESSYRSYRQTRLQAKAGIGQECQCADGSVGPQCCTGIGGTYRSVGPSDKPTALRCPDGCPFSVLAGKCICPSM